MSKHNRIKTKTKLVREYNPFNCKPSKNGLSPASDTSDIQFPSRGTKHIWMMRDTCSSYIQEKGEKQFTQNLHYEKDPTPYTTFIC